jgi:ankyrin repeat protein
VDGSTPLHLAAVGGNAEIVRFLVELGTDADARNAQGMTPLHCASGNGYVEMPGVC